MLTTNFLCIICDTFHGQLIGLLCDDKTYFILSTRLQSSYTDITSIHFVFLILKWLDQEEQNSLPGRSNISTTLGQGKHRQANPQTSESERKRSRAGISYVLHNGMVLAYHPLLIRPNAYQLNETMLQGRD